jgi:hypothetical protein
VANAKILRKRGTGFAADLKQLRTREEFIEEMVFLERTHLVFNWDCSFWSPSNKNHQDK